LQNAGTNWKLYYLPEYLQSRYPKLAASLIHANGLPKIQMNVIAVLASLHGAGVAGLGKELKADRPSFEAATALALIF